MLTDGWFPWLIIEASGLAGFPAAAHVRALAGMRASLGMYARLHAAAHTISRGQTAPRSDEARTAYALVTVGGMWRLLMMKDEGSSCVS
jgi:hypothetical protein